MLSGQPRNAGKLPQNISTLLSDLVSAEEHLEMQIELLE